MLLLAIEETREKGVPEPVLIPVGLHYSDHNRFRERALIEVHSPMKIPPLPGENGAPAPSEQMISDFGKEDANDRAWVQSVTAKLGGELQRTSHGLDSWEDRKLLWRTRGLVSVHRNRAEEEIEKQPLRKQFWALVECVLRGYICKKLNQTGQANELRSKVERHAEIMQSYGLSEYELYDRNKRPGLLSMISAMIQFTWCWIWMLGLITWSALIGSYPPYRIAGPIAAKSAEDEPYALGTKGTVAFMLLPIWWVLVSFPIAWLLAGTSSPVWAILEQGALGFLKPTITSVPWLLLAFIIMPLWSVGARLHLRLWQRSLRAMQTLRRWFRLRDGSIPWNELSESQVELAQILDSIGRGLVLPGLIGENHYRAKTIIVW